MDDPNPYPETPYFERFLHRAPPRTIKQSPLNRAIWQLLASATICFGFMYIHWRWTSSLNTDAPLFSISVAFAETLTFLGSCLFFYDIWQEEDTPRKSWDEVKGSIANHGQKTRVDIFITTLDESADILTPTITSAQNLTRCQGVETSIYILDDGNRETARVLAKKMGAHYIGRTENRGYKAGNLTHALYQTRGDFIVICDADTQLFPSFLQNTLGYFSDPNVAWVQTPHWFFDLPPGQKWSQLLPIPLGKIRDFMASLAKWVTGSERTGQDPFMSNPIVFFDIIQRRRNRNGASFCCGAGSIHRRDALFEASLLSVSSRVAPLNTCEQQPFRYHVSEDILTSIALHSAGWTSVFHPQVEARMLSPWSSHAWAAQKLKYAGGTFDIMLRANPCFRGAMPWKIRLHYLSTFWSYASVLWFPLLLLAPLISLTTGLVPIHSDSLTFFVHFLPVLVANEAAVFVGTKGYSTYGGRCMSLGTLPIQFRALWMVLCGHSPKFPPTPKTPGHRRDWRYGLPILWIILALLAGAGWVAFAAATGITSHNPAFFTINLFWISINLLLLTRVLFASLSVPARHLSPS
ncbi:MAG: glycosyltransferase [Cognatishimia sp.]|uniref:glycosyltransferase n=1 Tax=Cognatishimia sp. TaxID=2211648 RepID=UPI00405A369C